MEVPYNVTYPKMHVMYLPCPSGNRQIPVKTFPSRNFFAGGNEVRNIGILLLRSL